ncbi:MAG: uroporphyrinogen-III C-methyltransferase [Phycisphaerae bacterium]
MTYSKAHVYLVGAGPGAADLITVAGAEVLGRANVVVYDYLANPKLLALCPSGTRFEYVGKTAGRHTLTQEQINALLVQLAQEYASVHGVIVRLKGGDPYVFGRGGEEGACLFEHHIPFTTIPGLTAGIAGSAYAGIPVTHRDVTSTVTFITGHEKAETATDSGRVNYQALAQLGGTLVFYMGVKSLPEICQKLVAAGMDPTTPAATVQWATMPKQRKVVSTLAQLPGAVHAAGVTAPAITIVGHVVDMHHALDCYARRPLQGQKILVTRSRQQASELSVLLEQQGAEVLEVPTIEIRPPLVWDEVDDALDQIKNYAWLLFTSANGVEACWQRLQQRGQDLRSLAGPKIGAVGPATAAALQRYGIQPQIIPEKFQGEQLAAALTELANINGQAVLILRADISRPILRDKLIAAGAQVTDVAIYLTARPEKLPDTVVQALTDNQIHWITFTSSSTAENLAAMLPGELQAKVGNIKRACLGPVTAQTLQRLGWPPTVTAVRPEIPLLVEAMCQVGRKA